MKQLFAQAMVIARRDFTSIVVTPTFIIFLLMPLVMIAVSGASGVGAASLASQTATKTRIVAIAGGDNAARLVAADQRLRALFGGDRAPPALTVMVPEAKLSAQSNAIMHPHDRGGSCSGWCCARHDRVSSGIARGSFCRRWQGGVECG